jgi:hypothetical protein
MPAAGTDESLYPPEMARAAVARAGEPDCPLCVHDSGTTRDCTCPKYCGVIMCARGLDMNGEDNSDGI